MTIAPAATTAPAATGVKPVAGGTLNVAYKSNFDSTDPVVGYSVQTWNVEHQIYTGLLTYDKVTTLIPELAEAMPTVSADGKVFTFKLRKGLKFSNGSPLTAADFKYSWERIFDPAMKSPFPAFFQIIQGAKEYGDSLNAGDGKVKEITGLKAVDDVTLQVTLTDADQTFLNIITMPEGAAVPKAEVEKHWDSDHKNNDFYKTAVGTGPFMVKEWAEGKGITLVKNPNYLHASEGLPYLDSIFFQVGIDETTAILKVKNGDIDLTGDNIPAAEYPNLLSDATFSKQTKTEGVVADSYVFMNNEMKPFDDVKVRQAFSYIFDRKKVLRLINNRGVETGNILPPQMPGYSKELASTSLHFDKKKAKDLLTAANFDFGQTLTFVSDDTDDSKKIVTSLIADLKDVGIKAEPKVEQSEAFFKDTGKEKNIQIGIINWYQDFPDPSDFIAPILSCGSAIEGGANSAWYCNKDVDALELKARGITDPKARLLAYQEIEKKIMDEQPWVPLYNPVATLFVGQKVQGYTFHPVWGPEYSQLFKTK